MKLNTKSISKGCRSAIRATGTFIYKHKRLIGSVTSSLLTLGGAAWACKNTFDIAPKVKDLHEKRETMTDKNDIRQSAVEEGKLYAKAYAGPLACLAGGQVIHVAVEGSMAAEIAELGAGLGAMQARTKKMEQTAEKIAEGEESPYAIKDPAIVGLSPYAVLFDEKHPLWQQNPLWRFREIEAAGMSANEILRRRAAMAHPKGMTVNDVYNFLSFRDTKLGSRGGWFYDPEGHPDADNRIDFLFYDAETKERITKFPDGINRPVWIDFNVDYGDVAEFLPKN